MKSFAVIDIETRGLSARPEDFILGCFYTDKLKRYFLKREEMVKFIFSDDNPCKNIFAHNSEYDYTCLFGNIITELDNSALFVGSLFIKAKKDGITFYNSMAILKTTVEQLGKHYGKEKGVLADKFKTAKPGEKITVNKEDIEYCYRDCEIIYDYLIKTFEFTKKIKPTIASCAMEIFVKNYLVRKFTRNELNEKFRHSYYGGRVECFRFGKINPCYKYDIVSLYPKVCTDMYFPDFSKIKRLSKEKFNNISGIINNYEGCAKVTVHHKENFVCVLPHRKDHEIIYPYGKWTAFYNFNELRKAISTGFVKIIKVHECYYAPKIFFSELSDYMKYYFDKKNTSTGSEKIINKFLLNALTGKFAQKDHGRKYYFLNLQDAVQFLNGLKGKVKHIKHHFSEDRDDLFVEIFKNENRKKSVWNIPTISSYITSEARVLMLDYYLKNKNYLCYTDTDSLVLSKPLPDKYVGSNLGEMKKEMDEKIDIIGNKRYDSFIKGKKHSYIKGVSKNHKKIKGNFFFKKMIRTKEALRRNIEAGHFIEVEKHLSNDYTKRIVHKNYTTPLKLVL